MIKIHTIIHEFFEWFFGLITMVTVLAILAVIPIINLISLGYLVQMGANISRTGILKNGLIGVKKSAIFGRIIFGAWLCLFPSRFLLELKIAAELTDPSGDRVQLFSNLYQVTLFLTILHILWACLRGGKLRHFFWPAPIKFYKWLKEKHSFSQYAQILWNYLSQIQIKSYFTLGFKAFLGGFLWLIFPLGLMIFASFLPPAGLLITIPTGFLLMWVVLHLPFLQIHLANEGNFKAIFDYKTIRMQFKKAPLLIWFSLSITILFTAPLYLLKIELTPKEIAWLPSLLFILFIFPTRLLAGFALYRSSNKDIPAHKFFQWISKIALIPVLLAYVLLVYITQYLSWNGAYSLLEQHAFLVPAPLLGL